MNRSKDYIGCSGFQYKDWKDDFYPRDLREKEWLKYYSDRFNSVEINSTFYGIPKPEDLKDWHEQVPGHFKFALKGSRYVTHMKKLNKPSEHVQKFYQGIAPLGGKIGPVLWQLPSNQHRDLSKLKSFFESLSEDFDNVIEFRHESWYCEEVYELLISKKVILCLISTPDQPEIREWIKTSDKLYLRFHGYKEWYSGAYPESILDDSMQQINKIGGIRNVFIYFNNDKGAYAPKDACKMQELFAAR